MKIEFYHTFAIPEKGINLKGQWDLNPTTPHLDQIDVNGKTLLDVACRDGWYSYYFEKRGAQVTGLDFDDRAARRFIHQAVGSKVQFLHMNVFSLKCIEEKRFDVVFAGDILCHVDNPLGLLKRMHHVAREEVYIVADTFVGTSVWYDGYIWKFNEQDLLKLIEIAGLKNVKVMSRYTIHSEYWKNFGAEFYDRHVALISCDRNPDWKLNLNEENVIPASQSFNGTEGLTYEIQGAEA